MASKINSRLKNEKAHGAKPYDRPQSIFRKVASTVRDMIFPSFLLNVQPWGRQNTENSECTEKTDDILTGNETCQISESAPTRLSKRLKYDSDNNLSSGRHLESRNDNWFAPTARKDHVDAYNELSDIQIPEKVKKETILAVNGDDHSENSEGSASTSGCSSLVSSHQERQDHFYPCGLSLRENALENLRKELNGKAIFRPKTDVSVLTDRSVTSVQNKIFSSSDLSAQSHDPDMSVRLHTRPQPMFQSPRPSFNISSFGGPSFSRNSSYGDKKASSPFYGGKTTYGGASAYRRAQLSTMPYQLSKSTRSKITVKESSSSDNFECMSSAAKRILNTLEKMSTPLMDVKKIPNRSPVDISSFTPASQRHNTILPFAKKTVVSSFQKGPPVCAFSKSSNASLLRSHIQLKKRNSTMDIPLREIPSSPLFQNQKDSTPEFGLSKGGGGKMRTRINQHLHHSSKANEEKQVVTEIDLPNIPLPIKKLPVINLPIKDSQKDSIKFSSSNCSPNISASKGQCNFTFSNPIEYSAPKTVIPPQKSFSESSFVFSSPVVVSEVTPSSSAVTPNPLNKETKSPLKETELYTGSVDDFLRTLSENSKNKTSKNLSEVIPKMSSNTYKADKELLEPTNISTGFGDKFKPPVGSWECMSCFVRNNESSKKCVACESENPNSLKTTAKEVSSSGFGDKFKPSRGSWECSSCLVRNNEADRKCIACESENPSSSKNVTASVVNAESKKLTPAAKVCQNYNKSFTEFGLQQTSGTWECDICMVRNSLEKLKCIACESPRKSNENTTDLKPSIDFKFGGSLPSSSPGTFKFGSFVMNAVPTTSTSTFKFGVISETTTPSSQQTLPSTFKFGVIPATTNSSNQQTTVSTFKFGVTPEITKPSDTIQFGSTSLPIVSTDGFKFNPSVSVSTAQSNLNAVSSSEMLSNVSSAISGTNDTKTKSLMFNVPNTKSQAVAKSPSENIAVKQTKSEDHSTTFSEVNATKELVENTPKDQVSKSGESMSDQTKATSQYVFKTPIPSTANSVFKTTTPESGMCGFSFGNLTTEQPQKSSTFSFGSKTAVSKTSTSTTSTEASNFLAATSTVDSANGSPFIFKNISNKPFTVVPNEKPTENSASLQIASPTTNQKDSLQPSSKFVSSVSTSSTTFMFGNTATASPFKFGTTTTTTTTNASAGSIPSEVSKPQGMFAFGSTSSTDVRDLKPSGFTFKSSTEEKQFSSQNQLGFTSFKQDPSSSVNVSAASSPFEFGKSLQTPSSTSGGFLFGAPKTESSPAPFSFGTNSNKSVGLPFTGFSQSQPVATTSTLAFSFGTNVSTTATMSGTFGTTSTPSNLFSFGAKNNIPATTNPVNSSGMPSNPTPVFGCTTSQSVFGCNTSTIPAFGTGLPQKQEMQGSFGFGSTPSSTVTQSPLFKFGSTQSGPLEKKPAVGPVQNAGFNFNLTASQQNDMGGSFSQNFNPSAPPNFNFAAGHISPAPFLFAANPENTTSANAGPRRIRKAVRRNLRKTND